MFGCRKKKSSKSKAGKDRVKEELSLEREGSVGKSAGGNSKEGSGRNSPSVGGSNDSGSSKTEAEKRFEEVQKQRVRITNYL